jgi:hypothetical protein
VVWQLVTPDGWVIYPLLKSALVVRKGLGTAPEPHLLAEVIPAFPADGTLSTGHANLQGNTVAYAEARYLGTNSHDNAGRLMAQGQWHTGTEVTIGELLVV